MPATWTIAQTQTPEEVVRVNTELVQTDGLELLLASVAQGHTPR